MSLQWKESLGYSVIDLDKPLTPFVRDIAKEDPWVSFGRCTLTTVNHFCRKCFYITSYTLVRALARVLEEVEDTGIRAMKNKMLCSLHSRFEDEDQEFHSYALKNRVDVSSLSDRPASAVI